MAEQKTKPTGASVDAFLNAVANEQQRADSFRILEMMREVAGQTPRMWGPTMVGFGEFHYVYDSGHEGDIFLTGFSPRRNALTLYFMAGLDKRLSAELKKLGKAKASKGCLYIKKLADVDLDILRDMIRANVAYLSEMAKAKATAAKRSRKNQK
jgi:hypothetical protein